MSHPLGGLRSGVKRSKFYFFSTMSCCITIKGIHKCSSMVANILLQDYNQTPLPPPPPPPPHTHTPWLGSKGHFHLFQTMVMFHIKKKNKCSNMVPNILPADPPLARPYPPPPPLSPILGMGSIGQKSTFPEHGHVANQIKKKKKCSNMLRNILPADSFPPPPLRPWGWGQ